METKAPTIPLGMRLDAAVQQINAMSSMQLYVAIVGLTIVFTTLLLGSANYGSPEMLRSNTSELKVHSPAAAKQTSGGPEPKWHLFKWINYAAVALFGWSVADFALNCTAYFNDSDKLMKFLAAWSLFLCYCFGFFGISFVHDTIDQQQQQQQPEERQAAASPAEVISR